MADPRDRRPLLPPTLLPSGLEVAVCRPPPALLRDLGLVLPQLAAAGSLPSLLIVPTCQRAVLDLVNLGPAVEAEKDAKLESFCAWAGGVVDGLAAAGHWADYVDPCSGLPMRSPGCRVPYPEVESAACLLHYKTYDAGGCRVLSHPSWGTAAYPATLFTVAPLEVLLQVMGVQVGV